MERKKFEWESKKELPLVTKCCGSLNWFHAISEDGSQSGDFCHDCEEITPDNIRRMTPEEYNRLRTGTLERLKFNDFIKQFPLTPDQAFRNEQNKT